MTFFRLRDFCALTLFGSASFILAGCQTVGSSESVASSRSAASLIERDIVELSSDAFNGRAAGSGEFDAAAALVERRFTEIGLTEPTGLASREPVEIEVVSFDQERTTLKSITGDTVLEPVTDYLFRDKSQGIWIGDLVFAGNGLRSKALSRDDYAGLDVKGRIVVTLGRITDAPSTVGDLYDFDTRAETARRAGAIGFISIDPRIGAPLPRGRPLRQMPDMPFFTALVSFDGAKKLLPNPRFDWHKLLYEPDQKLPESGPLGIKIVVGGKEKVARLSTSNVFASIKPCDANTTRPAVMISAHLDHIGNALPEHAGPDGDVIHNGAIDNAAGVASMLEVARILKARRSCYPSEIIFAAFSAEEMGLLGSTVATETYLKGRIGKVINLDMPILTYKFPFLIASGGRLNDWTAELRQASRASGMKIIAPPIEEDVLISRSDHSAFLRDDVPAVSLFFGADRQTEGAREKYMSEHLHRVDDEVAAQKLLYGQAVRYAQAAASLAEAVSTGSRRIKN